MKIGIIGVGIIGGACKYGFEKLGHQVICHDILLKTKIEDVLDCKVVYVCVPTPSTPEGACDTSIVEDVIHELNQHGYAGIVAIKSTVKPTTTEKMIKETTLTGTAAEIKTKIKKLESAGVNQIAIHGGSKETTREAIEEFSSTVIN